MIMKKIISIALTLLALVSTNAEAQTLSANNATITINGTTQGMGYLRLDIKDAENCTAVGFRLSFPSELYGKDISIPIDLKHEYLEYRNKYLFCSDDNETFVNSVRLMTLSVCSDFTASGVYNCRITDIEFATKDFKLITQPDVQFTVTVNNPNAIDGIYVNPDGGEQIYSVSGIKQSQLQKGVNIIRKADGKTVKIFR